MFENMEWCTRYGETHKFEPRYNKKDENGVSEYLGDICVRCGTVRGIVKLDKDDAVNGEGRDD